MSQAPDIRQVPIADIRIDGETQPRVEISEAVVAEYAEDMATGFPFPPAVVFHDGTDYWLADGFHRYHAARLAGLTALRAQVIQGTVAEARWYSCGANRSHGLRRTNADKRKAVQMALSEHPADSDGAIAKHCGVSDHFVGNVRREVRTVRTSEPRVGLDGKRYPPPPPRPPPGPRPQPAPQPAAPAPLLDSVGREVPPEVMPVWMRRSEMKDILRAISVARAAVRNLQDREDPIGSETNFSSALAHANQFYADAETLVPYAVCPSCHGLIGCRLCGGRGVISKFRWDTCVSREMKEALGAVEPNDPDNQPEPDPAKE